MKQENSEKLSLSHREFRLRNAASKHFSGKNIFWSTLTAKSRGGKIFEFLHCPFEGRANMHHKIQPGPVLFGWWLKRTM